MIGTGGPTLKLVVAAVGGLMLLSWPVAGVLVLLWVFWEDMGGLALELYDDYGVGRAERGLSRDLHADVSAYHAHLMAARRERLRRERAGVAWRRWSRQVYAAVASCAFDQMSVIQRKRCTYDVD